MSAERFGTGAVHRSADLIKRVEIGFHLRRQELKNLIAERASANESDAPDSRNQIGSHKVRQNINVIEDQDQIDLRSLSQRFLPLTLSVSEYVEYLNLLLPPQYYDMLLGYYFSGEFVVDSTRLLELPFYDDAQFSILCQTLHLNGKIARPDIADAIDANLTRLIRFARRSHIGPICSLVDFQRLMEKCGAPYTETTSTLASFNQYLAEVKVILVHVIGPDLFTLLQQLCDPDFTISESWALKSLDLCDRWHCNDLFSQLMAMRASRGDPLDIEALDKVVAASAGKTCHRLSPETLALYRAWDTSNPYMLENAAGPPAAGLKCICAIRHAISDQDPEKLVDGLIELYNIDQHIMEWVDWDHVYQTLRYTERLEGLKMSAVHLIMGQPFVGRKFQAVKMAEGDGAFESSLRTSVTKFGERNLNALAGEIAKFSGNCRDLLVQAMLNHDTIAMLSIILQYDPPWAKKLVRAKALTYDARVSALRSDIANALAKHGLLERIHADTVVKEEHERLRVAYLQGRQLEGLVHINWQSIAEQIDSAFVGQISLVRRLLREPDLHNSESYVHTVTRAIAKKISDFVLTDGPDDIKTTISDSLRHGQLPNRFLLAFDRAISHATAAPIDTHSLIRELQSIRGPKVHWLIRLRQELVRTIRLFNEECLTVSAPSDLHSEVLQNLEEFVRRLVRRDVDPIVNTLGIPDCVHLCRTLVEKFLQSARHELSARLLGYFATTRSVYAQHAETAHEKLSLKHEPILDRSAFFNALHEHVRDAEHDALLWIAMAASQDTPGSFYLTDVVQLCLLNHQSRSSRELSVNAIVSERRPDSGVVVVSPIPLIKGQYFDLIEVVVKNLLSNAFARSGYRLQTRVTIELIDAPGRLTIKSKNTVSTARYLVLQKDLIALERSANKDTLVGAGDDRGSGIQKIRWAFKRFLGVMPVVRLSLATQPNSFEISINARHHHVRIINE